MSSDDRPGPLIGTGRTADVYAVGGRRVLRRYRNGDSAEREAEVMAYLAGVGFPVPRVYDASGPDLVMERLVGRDMLADLSVRPWLARRHARTLAGLHDRLHAITASSSLQTRFGPGDRMLHLGLHPGNVMLTAAGPVVIDWANVAAGAPAADVAMTWLIIATSEVDAPPMLLRPAISSIRAVLLRRFRALVRDDPGPELARVARARMTDPNIRPAEARRLQAIADQASRRASARLGGEAR
jgi:aminoglycoside phosphotransferase (APT) family kinase protein